MTSKAHTLATIRHADEILARCGLPTYTERCDQLARLAEVAVAARSNNNIFVMSRDMAADLAARAALATSLLVQRDELLEQIATLQATLDDTVELADELLKHA